MTDDILNREFTSQVLERSSKVPPSRREFRNNATRGKLVRKLTLQELQLLSNALYLMSLVQYRTVISHLVIMELLHGIDMSILHHAFISIFIALRDVSTHYITLLMPFHSYFIRFT